MAQPEAELAAAVNEVLARVDWQLHLPEFATVPFLGSEKEYSKAKGRTKQGDRAFLVEPASHSTQDALRDGSSVRRTADTAKRNQEDEQFLVRNSPLPRELRGTHLSSDEAGARVLRRVTRSAASGSDPDEAEDFNALRRLTAVGVKGKCILGEETLRKCVLGPLQHALSDSEDIRDDQDLECLFRSRWDEAAHSILHRFQLSSSGRLEWRPSYFRYSISTLILRRCDLQPECFGPIGEFLAQNRNLTELDLAENEQLLVGDLTECASFSLGARTALPTDVDISTSDSALQIGQRTLLPACLTRACSSSTSLRTSSRRPTAYRRCCRTCIRRRSST